MTVDSIWFFDGKVIIYQLLDIGSNLKIYFTVYKVSYTLILPNMEVCTKCRILKRFKHRASNFQHFTC